MPFTFSHPAAVLPATLLPKRAYSLTGLMIGSMVPDFEYFIRMKGLSIYSHEWLGILWFDLPLALLLSFIYHSIVRDPLIANLPTVFRSRLKRFTKFDWALYVKHNWFIVIPSILVGTATHIIWDGFTHENGYFVKILPFLQHNFFILGHWIPLYNLGQHFSTLIGGLAVLYFILQIPADNQVKSNFKIYYWVYVFVISVAIFALRVALGSGHKTFDYIIVSIIASGMIAITITSLCFRYKKVNV